MNSLDPAFEISVVRAPGTTKQVAGQPKILMWLSDWQPSNSCPSCEIRPHWRCSKYTDNQKLGQTIRNWNLVVRGTTIYFSLIRTLLRSDVPQGIFGYILWLQTLKYLDFAQDSKQTDELLRMFVVVFNLIVVMQSHWLTCTFCSNSVKTLILCHKSFWFSFYRSPQGIGIIRGLSLQIDQTWGPTTAKCHRTCHTHLQKQTLPGTIR